MNILPEKLSGYGITVGHIAQVIQGFNTEQLVGSVEINSQFFFVESGAFFSNARDFSLLFGVFVSTVLTLLVIPFSCISLERKSSAKPLLLTRA